MKKVLAILALTLFIGGISATAVAASVNSPAIELHEDDKKSEEKKSDTKAEATKKSGDCSSECESKCKGEKKSDSSESTDSES